MTINKTEKLIQMLPAAAPVISSFMSKLLKPMAQAIINREDTPDGHKHRLLNNFIPAAIDRTKLAGTQAAENIRKALTSK